jgi:multidrug efflux system membrane fusion protein
MPRAESTQALAPRCGTQLVVLLALVAVGCVAEEAPPAAKIRAIQWQRVSAEAGRGERVISGIVTAVDDTRLAFEVAGVVATVDVNLGDTVDAGQVLATLDPEPLELTVRDAEAQLTSAQATFTEARVSFERARSLFEQEVISAAERDHAQARFDSAESAVDAAGARLGLTQRDLRRSTLRAPFAGSISERNVDPAQKVFSGQVAFEMDSGESGLRVEVQMPETLIALMRQGDEVSVTFPSTGTTPHPARIAEVGTRAGAGNAFTVRADLIHRVATVRPGMTAEVHFSYGRVASGVLSFEGFMIPIAAIRKNLKGETSVFVFDSSSSTVRETPITIGGTLDNSVAVLEGLENGAVIATAGVSFLHDGQAVKLLE